MMYWMVAALEDTVLPVVPYSVVYLLPTYVKKDVGMLWHCMPLALVVAVLVPTHTVAAETL